MIKRDWRLLNPWLKQLSSYRSQLVIGIALALATALFGIGLLSLSGWFITAAALYVGFDIYTPGGGIRFFAVARTVSRYFERLLNHDLVLKLQASWRVALFRLLQKIPLHKTLRFRVSDTVQQLTRNLNAMDNLLIRLVMPALVFILASLLLLVFWSFYNTWLSLVLLSGALATGCCAWRLAVKSRKLAVKSLRQQQRLRDNAMNFADSVTELSAWGCYDSQTAKVLNKSKTLEQLEIKQLQLQQRTQWITDVIAQLVALLVLVLALVQFKQGQISAAEVIMLALSALAWQELANELPVQWAGYGNTLAAARRLLESKTSKQSGEPHRSEKPESKGQASFVTIQIKELTVWRQQRPLLEKLNISFKPGLVHWVEGASGIGKSTLAEVLMGLYPDNWIQGEITTQPDVCLRNEASYLTQETEIFDASVRDNLNPKRLSLPESKYWNVLKLVHLDEKIASLADRLDTRIGSRGVKLSGGQLRRLALARVLLQDKPVIILDEPFAGIERHLVKDILERLVAETEDKTWIIISHVSVDEINAEIPVGQRLIL
ncbi:ATP-binding cassette domain-containing protein [Idiomarina abyssalis]|uniref:ATP-binding cassette domain-containing protein n=1 Tax=Idiomarina abyssalis TaxID=86102 RepID=A0A8I1G8N8_9GAMM|nr:ATP-binding cassette domain-containing protein [Idiomarina abyssalis]MBJ7266732.1 ATP-binding cassette domain-containing protein [Idiomarina abyssalis]MBJ7273001.1 ATP-binding cassette domain-containing protein [Idiomarina abyssalis]MBJ7315655.1 ATP-binding cassette domain-containing protein [Idiomarina abyssalis]